VLEPAFADLAPNSQSGFMLVTNLRFSPDGAHLAFTVRRWTRPELMRPSAAAEGDIYTVKADGTARERLAIGEEPAELAGWMPDGRGIAFVSERNGVRTMFAIPVDQGRARGTAVTLSRGVPWSVPLGITSAGSLTYAVDGRVLGSYIADLRENTPARTPITVPTGDWVVFPAWSPDGRHLAFGAGLPHLPPASPVRLTNRDLATGEDRVVLQWNGALTRGTSWTADGKGLVISRVIGSGTFQIDRVDVATGAVQSLVPSIGMPVSFPRLTPDARHLYFLAAETRLMRVDLATGQRTELIAIAEWFDLSRDGSQLAFVQSNGPAYVLKLQPTDGSPSRDLIRFGPQDRINSISFVPDGQSLVFAKAGDGPFELFRVSTTGQPNPLPLGVIGGQSFPDVSVHPDGRRLAFIDNEWSGDFWQMNGLSEAFAAAVRAPAPIAATPPRDAPRAK
jgi:Tol biopolymer transport system component